MLQLCLQQAIPVLCKDACFWTVWQVMWPKHPMVMDSFLHLLLCALSLWKDEMLGGFPSLWNTRSVNPYVAVRAEVLQKGTANPYQEVIWRQITAPFRMERAQFSKQHKMATVMRVNEWAAVLSSFSLCLVLVSMQCWPHEWIETCSLLFYFW